MKKLRRFLGWLAAVLVVAFVALLFPFDPPKWTVSEIGARVDLLNEKAAIETPHHTLGKKIRAAHLALFEKVESGQQLTAEESAEYRVLYQTILNQKQHELSLLDGELTVLTNYMPEKPNNVGSFGIEGKHDHHDASAGANLAALRQDLQRMESASGPLASFTRVRAAIEAYKDLDDVVLHMATAPQTKSVSRTPETSADELQAQFEPVNSPAYATDVHAALDRYDAMVLLVQDRVYAHLGPVERSLTQRWGSRRSLAPSLKGVTTKRIPRTSPTAVAKAD